MEKFTTTLDEFSTAVENLLKDGATVPVYISGSSMTPFLVSRRDLVWLRSPTDGELKKGKIILFKRDGGRLILHRIRSVLSQDVLKVNGDSQSYCELVKKSNVIAVVSEIERKGRRKSADALSFKLINFVWQALMPLRPLIMRAWSKAERMKKNR